MICAVKALVTSEIQALRGELRGSLERRRRSDEQSAVKQVRSAKT